MFQMTSHVKYGLDASVFEWYASADRIAAQLLSPAHDAMFGVF
jgi:hypothetical protein